MNKILENEVPEAEDIFRLPCVARLDESEDQGRQREDSVSSIILRPDHQPHISRLLISTGFARSLDESGGR